MSITYTCPHCGAPEILEHKLVGRFGRCPECGQIYPASAQADVAELHDPPVPEPAKKERYSEKPMAASRCGGRAARVVSPLRRPRGHPRAWLGRRKRTTKTKRANSDDGSVQPHQQGNCLQ